MQNYFSNIILKSSICLLIFTITSCGIIFEKNLEDEAIDLIIPSDKDTLFTNLVHFKWEPMVGAKSYHIQIVRPDFDNISNYFIDSSIAINEIKLVLDPGHYSCRIRGENSAYQSIYFKPITIFIDSISDLTAQSIQLLNPSSDWYTNSSENSLFTWQKHYAADYYGYELRKGDDFQTGELLYEDKQVASTSFNYFQTTQTELIEGNYTWGVKAVNDISSTEFVTRVFHVDLTAPNSPVSLVPINNFTNSTDEVLLKWSLNNSDPGFIHAPIQSIVEISDDDSLFNLMNTAVKHVYNVDSLTVYFNNPGNYWWRVILEDEAGNMSDNYSESRQIKIK